MKNIFEIIKTTLKGGFLFLVPFFVVAYILTLIFSKLKGVLESLSEKFSLEPLLGDHIHWFLILVFLLLICFLIGLLARAKTAQQLLGKIEDSVLGHLPGYSILKNASESILNDDSGSAIKVILLDGGDTQQIGFVMNVIDENQVALFIPDVPNPMSGGLVFVKKEKIKELDLTYKAAIDILKSVGTNSSKHLSGKLS